MDGLAERILGQVTAAGGTPALQRQEQPEAIRDTFDTSKKAFKQALTALRKAGKITEHYETEYLTLKSAGGGATYKRKRSTACGCLKLLADDRCTQASRTTQHEELPSEYRQRKAPLDAAGYVFIGSVKSGTPH